MNTVWVLSIHHRHGTNLYANLTEDGAKNELLGYVEENWHEIAERTDNSTEIPTDRDEAIKIYFELQGDEYPELDQLVVGP